MTQPSIYCSGCSVIDDSGIRTIGTSRAWEDDQDGPAAIKRAQVLGQPYMAFGKLNLPDKLAFSAASLVLNECSVRDPENTGIFLGIPFGSCSTDLLYRQSVEQGSPSPALFSATLPSSPIADIAIYYKFKGPDAVFPGGDSPLLSAIERAQHLLQRGKLTGALVIFVEETAGNPPGNGYRPPFASAVYFEAGGTVPEAFPEFSYHLTKKTEPSECTFSDDRSLATVLLDLLHRKKSSRIAVPVCGFKGYISLHYT
ncbi:MAG: hypothetical protein JW863_05790 [Chitinispirillaceae bacterium]|nr:hypothetical protein [Chitinispirillaceae bacterium]